MNNTKEDRSGALPDWLFEKTKTLAKIEVPYFLTQLNTLWPDLESRLNIHTNDKYGILNSIALQAGREYEPAEESKSYAVAIKLRIEIRPFIGLNFNRFCVPALDRFTKVSKRLK